MSKTCCNISYASNDKFCQMCGKKLEDTASEYVPNEQVYDLAFVPNEYDDLEGNLNEAVDDATTVTDNNIETDATTVLCNNVDNDATTVLCNNVEADATTVLDNNKTYQLFDNSTGMYNQPTVSNGIYQQPMNSNGIYQQPMNSTDNYTQPMNPNGMYQQHNDLIQTPAVSKKQSNGLKVFSILLFSISIIGLIAILTCAYLFWFNPSYKEYSNSAEKYEQNVDGSADEL